MTDQDTKMDPRIKALWVHELRDGGHEQGAGVLRRLEPDKANPEYCCLGILCEIAVREGVIEPPVPGHEDHIETVFYYGGEDTNLLPRVVMKWAGLYVDDPKVDAHSIGRDEVYLAGLNDAGVPFTEIAQLIEEQL
jgi:hypothetical protein